MGGLAQAHAALRHSFLSDRRDPDLTAPPPKKTCAIEAGNHIYDQTAPEQVAAAAAGGPANANPADWTLPTPIYGGYGGQLVFFETMTPMVRTAYCIHRKR